MTEPQDIEIRTFHTQIYDNLIELNQMTGLENKCSFYDIKILLDDIMQVHKLKKNIKRNTNTLTLTQKTFENALEQLVNISIFEETNDAQNVLNQNS
jgi:uncharacterized protein (UPF0147 family)